MSSEFAIKVENLSKCYQIYAKPRDRLRQLIYPRVQRLARKQVNQYFREFWALKNVSFEIKKGETIGIIGRNGSGKSTLLQLICGTLNPTNGSIQTQGRIAALLELGSGFNPEFTGRENVYMGGSILGLSQAEIDERYDDIAAFADIGEFINQPVKTYSSGMYVRLAFAVNIMSKPDIMIVDEALAVGDMAFQSRCLTALTRIQQNGTSILFVSHDIGSVKSLCSRGVYLEQGHPKAIGAAGDVAESYIRDTRDLMNTDYSQLSAAHKNTTGNIANKPVSLEVESVTKFKISEDFAKRVALFRYGTGSAKITYAELLDSQGNNLINAEFDQPVEIKIYFTSTLDAAISPNYNVLDDKKNYIIGADPQLLGKPLVHAQNGHQYIATFKTRLPLHEGAYSIQFQLTKISQAISSVEFLDVIDDAIVFKVDSRAINRIWTKVFLENTFTVEAL